ncbi:hypothetical protein BDB00DRAFT_969258, partial [Zychaea mexicana]|uniref:uncharacterized protein n=1 Tax=Zychaea mexicana TaxID=64656 RepID=UPI0022FE43D8
MNHLPFQAAVTMLPTSPPMSTRLPFSNNNGRTTTLVTTKQTIDEGFEPSSFAFPRLTQWPAPVAASLHQEDADRERWRHSEDNGVLHGLFVTTSFFSVNDWRRVVIVTCYLPFPSLLLSFSLRSNLIHSITLKTERHQQGSSSPHHHHFLSENDKSYLGNTMVWVAYDRRDNHFVHTEFPSNDDHSNDNHGNQGIQSDTNGNDSISNNNDSWWRREEDSFQQQQAQEHPYHSVTFRVDCPTAEQQQDDRPIKKRSQNAFVVFSSERRGQIRAQQPRIRNSDLNKLLGKEWKGLSDGHRSHYKQRAEILKEQAIKDLYRHSEEQSSSSSISTNSISNMIGSSLLVSSSSSSQQQHNTSSITTPSPTAHNHHHSYDYNYHYQHHYTADNQHHHYNQHQSSSSSSHTRFTATGSNGTSHSSSECNVFTTPRHLSVSSERSHDALFVAANNTSPAADWHSNASSRSDDEEEDDHNDDDENVDDREEDRIRRSPSSPSPPLLTSRGVMSEIASGAGAAEAEALAGLASSMQQRNDDTLKKRLAGYKRPGEKPKRVKRPPNAYLLFNRDVRHKILDGNPNLTVAEISKRISERWNSLSEEHKAYYNQEAARLKQRHMDNHPNFIYSRRSKAELEKAGYRSRPSKKRKARDPRGRKKKRLKNPTAPKHPMSGFLFYSISVRSEIVADMPKATVGGISKVIAERWRKLREDERAPWIQKAKEDKERYARQMESF